MKSKLLHRLFLTTCIVSGIVNLAGFSLYVFSDTWIRIRPDEYKIEDGKVYLRSIFWSDIRYVFFFNGEIWLIVMVVYAIAYNRQKYREKQCVESEVPKQDSAAS